MFGLVQDSIVDGPGLRFSVFVQGCPHHCPGCHNPESHDPQGGEEISVGDIITRMLSNPLTDGLTLTGGEPFEQPVECWILAKSAHVAGKSVWAYTGYTFEEIMEHGDQTHRALLSVVDVLVDGPFKLEDRTLSLPWRGSKNQRIIDVQASLECGSVVLWKGGEGDD